MYSSLHNHSEFSVLDGYGHPQEYLERARSVGLNAFAITEHGNAYSWIYFDELKKNYPEIKMIYGVELYECFDMSVKDSNSKYFHLVALAKNERGRVALNEIVTQSNFEGFYFKPRIDLAHLRPYADDLIILSACLASKLARESDYGQCVQYIDEYKSAFPNFFLEMQSHNTDEQCRYNQKVLELAEATNTEFVITTDSHAATKDDLYYQARHVQIAHDDETLTELYDGCYIQSEAEIYEVMSSQIGEENVKLGLANTNKVADMIENVDMPFQAPQLPTYPLPDGFEDNLSYLKHLTEKGWKQRGFYKLNGDAQRIREKRLEYELGIIHQMGFDGYFLIVWDFIKHAKENGQAVGDGRGSGGGSIVNFLLGISELDPIENDLIFERFLNPERVSMPDIDCDFSNREFIIDYLTQKYGEDRVCQIINYSYITPIVAIKDVGKVLGIPYSVCDRISKKFTYKTFEECIENNKSLLDDYSEYNELFRIASHISGRLRNVSIHAGGVGIVDAKITDYMPMKLGSKGEHVIQVDKKKVEEIGIIKFDVLGVATLAAVQEAMEDIGLSEWDLSINNPEFANDTAMYELLASARTNGVFQVESSGMRDLLLRLKPTNLEDVSAVLALYRPDSMGALEDYIERKNGGKAITYIHPDMEPILQKTYGCLIYQEQLMDVVRKFGGRSYGGADKFRKAIGKKNIELVKEESEKLYGEIIANGYPEGIAKQISDDLKEKGGYLFNKSHSALYSILTLKTAHLKAHYPEYFFKALLNQNRNDYGVINKYIIDTKAFGVSVLPPNINRSERYFTVHNSKILFGLEAIRGVGEKVVTQILEERKANGLFTGLNDFITRVSPSTAVVVSLIKAGALPCKDKRELLERYAQSLFEQKEYTPVKTIYTHKVMLNKYGIDCSVIKGKEERLALLNSRKRIEFYTCQEQRRMKEMHEFEEKYMQNEAFWEFEALSIFLGVNPFEYAYQYINVDYDEAAPDTNVTIVGIIANVQKKKDRTGKQFAFLNMYSVFGLMEVVCWHTQFKQNEDIISRGAQVAMLCKKGGDEKLTAVKAIKPYTQWLKDRKISDI